jgi:Yip1 domain
MNANQSPNALSSAPQPWYQAWADAVTKPNVQAYEGIVSRPGVTTARAFLWVFLSTTIGYGLTFLLLRAFPGYDPLSSRAGAPDLASSALLFVCLGPIAGVFSVLGLIIVAGVSQSVARALGGTGTFAQLAYAIAAYTSPISIISSVIAFIPLVRCLGLPIGLYALFLNVIAVKAVHHLSWGRALLSSTAVLAGILVLVACLAIVALALMGPAIGNVFSNIITDLGTPTP